MKIALLHYSAPPVVGGVESVLAHHALLMTQDGHAVEIFAGRGRTFDTRIPVHVLPRLDSRNAEVLQVKQELDDGQYAPAFDALRERIQNDLAGELRRFDLVIAHNIASLHKNLPLAAMLFEACKAGSLPPLILWHHDLAWSTPRYRHELHDGHPWDLLRSAWPCAVHVVVSEQRRSQLSALHGDSEASIRVVPNGVDLGAFFKLEPQTTRLVNDLKLATADPLFLLPARLTPRKNIELALQILVELRHEFPRAALVITGPEGPHNPANAAYMRKLLDLRDQLNLRGAAHFLAEATAESIPDALIADFYQLADALLFPSREEGFGIPIIEAAISCKPVFCADIPVLRELGGDEVSYFHLDAEPRAIAHQIADRLGSEATSRLARRAKQSYTWDSIYERHIGPLIREVVL